MGGGYGGGSRQDGGRRDFGREGRRPFDGCYGCGSMDHMARDCPQQNGSGFMKRRGPGSDRPMGGVGGMGPAYGMGSMRRVSQGGFNYGQNRFAPLAEQRQFEQQQQQYRQQMQQYATPQQQQGPARRTFVDNGPRRQVAQANAVDLEGDADDEYEYEYTPRPRRQTAGMARQLADAVVAAAMTHVAQGPRQVMAAGAAPSAAQGGQVMPGVLAQTPNGVPVWVPASMIPNRQGGAGANGGAQGNGQ
jgi:hypothetical protein